MADYTDLSNAAVGIGGLPSGATVTALRDNPIAIAEAAVGAPKIYGESLADEGNGFPILTVSASDTVSVDRGANSVSGITSTLSTTDVVAQTYTMLSYTGSMRFTAKHNAPGSGSSSILSVYKNDVLVNSWSTKSATAVERIEDISFSANDVIEWRHKTNNSSLESTFIVGQVRANDGYVIRDVYAKFSAL